MCDLGLTLGIGMGIMSAVGQAQTASANADMINEEAKMKQDMRDREYIVESRASQKEAHRAALERDAAVSHGIASGTGIMGSTAGLRVAEQTRQGSLSIQNAKDRREAAAANREAGVNYDAISAQNRIAVESQSASPLNLAATVLQSGVSHYGAFR